jgi:Ser/Thr protein kinase RdoA (MazF antagonist)
MAVGTTRGTAVDDQPRTPASRDEARLDGQSFDEERASRLGTCGVLRAYESSYELRAAVREVDERWTELHWIHGNLTATNVLVQHQPALRVSFIDPYGVGLGDPAWIWPQPWT